MAIRATTVECALKGRGFAKPGVQVIPKTFRRKIRKFRAEIVRISRILYRLRLLALKRFVVQRQD